MKKETKAERKIRNDKYYAALKADPQRYRKIRDKHNETRKKNGTYFLSKKKNNA